MTAARFIREIDLLRWVDAHPKEAFDPSKVGSTARHGDDPEWVGVQTQMEDLRIRGYITLLNRDPDTTTYWLITLSGQKRLRALEDLESTERESLSSDEETPRKSSATSELRLGKPSGSTASGGLATRRNCHR